jgi:beta-glucosidase
LDLGYSESSLKLIKSVMAQDSDIPLISVQFSGRPMAVADTILQSDAFIAAWLPGTSGGEAVVSSIFGDYLFKKKTSLGYTNTLSVNWFGDEAALKNYPVYGPDGKVPSIMSPLYPIGYGLATSHESHDHSGSQDEDDDSNDFSGILWLPLLAEFLVFASLP